MSSVYSANNTFNLKKKFIALSFLLYFIIFLSSAIRLGLFFGNMALFGKIYYIGLSVPFLLTVTLWLLRYRLDNPFGELFQGINVSLFVSFTSITVFQLYLIIPQNFFFNSNSLVARSFDERSTSEVVLKMRQQGIMAYPAPLPAATLEGNSPSTLGHIKLQDRSLLGLSGVSNSTTVYCSEAGPYLIYDSDEYGFANPKQIWSQKMELVFVGDSFTHGACVAVENHFTSIVREYFPGTFNLGMRGNGPLLELATLKEFVKDSNPKYIFWMYFDGNDLKELTRESMDPIAIKYLLSNFNLDYKNNIKKIDKKLAAALNGLLGRSEAPPLGIKGIAIQERKQQQASSLPDWKIDWLTRLSDFFTFGDFITFGRTTLCASVLDEFSGPCKNLQITKNISMFRNVLTSAKRFADLRGAKLVFVSLPKLRKSKFAEKKRMSMVRGILNKLNIDELDFRSVADQWGFGVDDGEIFAFGKLGGHYNELGYGLVGCAVLNYISKDSENFDRPSTVIDCSEFVRNRASKRF